MITFNIYLQPCDTNTLIQYLEQYPHEQPIVEKEFCAETFSYLEDDLGIVLYDNSKESPYAGCKQSVHIHRVLLSEDEALWEFTEKWFPDGKRGAIKGIIDSVQRKYFDFTTAVKGDRFGIFISSKNDDFCYALLKKRAENLNGMTWSLISSAGDNAPVRREFQYHLEYGNEKSGYSLALYIDCTESLQQKGG